MGNARPNAIKQPDDIAAHVIQCHEGDAVAAVETLLDEIHHLQNQLSIAVVAMGRGCTRGWKPSTERE
ncbi:hypothetical protein EXN24_17220 [Rhizobium rhizogenes]|uniref:Uncharacterized protein n=1 Tax=Rhizobium rhizogenes TaxID=359 RepID=A0AA95AHP5_RHIRH|nr:hypothetical protein [Rhizobium rhizogenes]QDG94315.1 hypothetical protein NIBR502774_15890 [Rhizobium sp. NIBRBAC000502774]TRA88365.1 hypothetical protein EXN24_17220 [Rhizobium rhizogenes]